MEVHQAGEEIKFYLQRIGFAVVNRKNEGVLDLTHPLILKLRIYLPYQPCLADNSAFALRIHAQKKNRLSPCILQKMFITLQSQWNKTNCRHLELN